MYEIATKIGIFHAEKVGYPTFSSVFQTEECVVAHVDSFPEAYLRKGRIL